MKLRSKNWNELRETEKQVSFVIWSPAGQFMKDRYLALISHVSSRDRMRKPTEAHCHWPNAVPMPAA
jgi:hypothetical protein